MDYYEIYEKRLNRYGLDYATREQGMRERDFENYLNKSVYRVNFDYDSNTHPGILERDRENHTKVTHRLLTRRNLDMPSGTIVELPNKDGDPMPWMIYWPEEIVASGYNRYFILRMSHEIEWVGRDGQTYNAIAYMYGQEDNMLKDELRSRSRADTVYNENLKLSFFVMPRNANMLDDDYIEIGEGDDMRAFVVTGMDIHSTPGVQFVSIDPVNIRDSSPPSNIIPNDSDYMWLDGGF